MTIKDDAQRLSVSATSPKTEATRIGFAQRLRWRFAWAVLFVLGFVLPAQAGQFTPGPQFCPFFGNFLTPSLLDAFFWPGATFRQ